MKLSKYIDHTVLAANASLASIEKLCQEARQYDFASVCVNGCYASYCAKALKGSSVSTCVVVGFPLGAMATKAKAYEAKCAIEDGATEIDMVINVGFLKDRRLEEVQEDIHQVKLACGKTLLKVIIEACLLTDEEKVTACKLAVAAGADYVKTSTGFSTSGAKVEDVALMRKTVGADIGVKAAGGIRTYESAKAMIDAGASRIGASAGIAILSGASDAKN